MTITDPPPQADRPSPGIAADRPEDAGQWTAKLRRAAVEALPPDRLLPDRQPAYVASWIYVFGVLTISALARGHRHRHACSPSWARTGGTSRRPGSS